MKILKIVARNARRHLLRTSLTVIGLAIAVMSFAVIRTFVLAWYSQADATSPNRLIVINKVSLGFSLPLSYYGKIAGLEGVTGISWAQWFGGHYVDESNFFPQFAVDQNSYLELYPEFIVKESEMEAFRQQRNAAIVGRKLADRFGWSTGDKIQLVGTIYPGDWDFLIAGIYDGETELIDESQFIFRWDYIDETMKQESPARSGYVGSFVVQIEDPSQSAVMCDRIDALFANSSYESLSQTEKAFQLSFVAMGRSLVTGTEVISILVIGIILLVLTNTMAMTARERISEYAVMKTLGFRPFHIVGQILGESLLLATIGGLLGLGLTMLLTPIIALALGTFFPIFKVAPVTLVLGFLAAILVGFFAALFPGIKAVRTSIVDGLRIID
ncbi:MAG: FtsX-like permease family protein [bacterium]|nr:FtsX-like permease family protein [bacterium]